MASEHQMAVGRSHKHTTNQLDIAAKCTTWHPAHNKQHLQFDSYFMLWRQFSGLLPCCFCLFYPKALLSEVCSEKVYLVLYVRLKVAEYPPLPESDSRFFLRNFRVVEQEGPLKIPTYPSSFGMRRPRLRTTLTSLGRVRVLVFWCLDRAPIFYYTNFDAHFQKTLLWGLVAEMNWINMKFQMKGEMTVAAPGQVWGPFVGINKFQPGYDESVDKMGLQCPFLRNSSKKSSGVLEIGRNLQGLRKCTLVSLLIGQQGASICHCSSYALFRTPLINWENSPYAFVRASDCIPDSWVRLHTSSLNLASRS